MWCRSWHFECILLVFFRWWGWLVMHDLIKHDALLWLVVFQQLWLVHFDPCCFTQWLAPLVVHCHTALLLLCFFYHGHPRFWNFYFTLPVDVVRVKSYMNCLFDPARVVIRVMINKLYFVPEWLVSDIVGMLWNSGGLGMGESDVLIVLSLILSCMGLPDSPMNTSPHSQGIL